MELVASFKRLLKLKRSTNKKIVTTEAIVLNIRDIEVKDNSEVSRNGEVSLVLHTEYGDLHLFYITKHIRESIQ